MRDGNTAIAEAATDITQTCAPLQAVTVSHFRSGKVGSANSATKMRSTTVMRVCAHPVHLKVPSGRTARASDVTRTNDTTVMKLCVLMLSSPLTVIMSPKRCGKTTRVRDVTGMNRQVVHRAYAPLLGLPGVTTSVVGVTHRCSPDARKQNV